VKDIFNMSDQKRLYNTENQLATVVIAGSVDDGKSTLIGRLLYDTDQVYDDQIAAVRQAGKIEEELDFSLFTDGLAAEREQKITIDVAYRYFSTAKRRFIMADVPGHEQYTRNMVTGASKANIAMILIDARKSILPQSKRHLTICNLMGIKHVVVVINKMDLVSYEEERFLEVKKSIESFTAKLQLVDIQFIPVSSLKGDMIVHRGENMPWYDGHTVVDYLETVSVNSDRNLIDARFPVQYVIRPNQDLRGYAGTVEGGIFRKNSLIKVLPSGQEAVISDILINGENHDYTFASQAAVLTLDRELDVSRGDMIVRKHNLPLIGNYIESMICWMDSKPLTLGDTYLIKHTTKTLRCTVTNIQYSLNTETLHREEVTSLGLNEIGKVELEISEPLIFDPYTKNRHTGSFILIDDKSFNTAGGGVILGAGESQKVQSRIKVDTGKVLWFTGLSGSGKSTIAEQMYTYLQKRGIVTERLDGDVLRNHITKNLGFSKEDREKNIDIAGFLADTLSRHNIWVVASFISPYREQREALRSRLGDRFVEIFVDAPLTICEGRDIKGLYKKARNGDVTDFTGVTHPYERPEHPDVVVHTDSESVEESVQKVITLLEQKYLG